MILVRTRSSVIQSTYKRFDLICTGTATALGGIFNYNDQQGLADFASFPGN